MRMLQILTINIGNTVLRQTGSLRNRAHGEGLLGREGVQSALEAGRHLRQDHAALALQALCTAIDERDDSGRIDVALLVIVHHACKPHFKVSYNILGSVAIQLRRYDLTHQR